MEYTPSSFTSLLNPCDYNHNDLPYLPAKRGEKKSSLLACRNLHHIKNIRKNLEAGNHIGDAVGKCGISNEMFYRWLVRYHSKRLKRYIHAAHTKGFKYLDECVEGAFYRKLKEGRGSGSEYAFFLTNRRPERWKNTNEFSPSESGAPVLKQRPLINYIAVHAENAKVEVSENGNGNGKRIEDHA